MSKVLDLMNDDVFKELVEAADADRVAAIVTLGVTKAPLAVGEGDDVGIGTIVITVAGAVMMAATEEETTKTTGEVEVVDGRGRRDDYDDRDERDPRPRIRPLALKQLNEPKEYTGDRKGYREWRESLHAYLTGHQPLLVRILLAVEEFGDVPFKP